MKIEPFGNIEYNSTNREWFGVVNNIATKNKVELTISAENIHQDISNQTESIKQFAADYHFIITSLYNLTYQHYENFALQKTLEEIKEMYFLAAVSLKADNKTWWLVLEPHFHVESIYDHFLRFTIVEREIIWSNLLTL